MNKAALTKALACSTLAKLDSVMLHNELDSTSSEAQRLVNAGAEGTHLIIANSQTAGRGRRGRQWVSPEGGIYLSLLQPVSSRAQSGLQALSLVTALSVHRALAQLGADGLQLKWPNDIVIGDRKLAGILLENTLHEGRRFVIFGIGVNLSLSQDSLRSIDRPVADLAQILGREPEPALVVASIVESLLADLQDYWLGGFSRFRQAWNSHDRYLDHEIAVISESQQISGRCAGVDDTGSLLLITAIGIQRLHAGEVLPSLRPRELAAE